MTQNNPHGKEKSKPLHLTEYCKGCGRCIEACPKQCISVGTDINALTGLVPVHFDLENCIGCSLCYSSCPEPYAIGMVAKEKIQEHQEKKQSQKSSINTPNEFFGKAETPFTRPAPIKDEVIPMPECGPLIIKGNYASAIGAILSGCRHFYGYPITPSTEGAELMAKLMPKLDGVFFQAVSEVATVNIMYGTGGAGVPCMTFTSSPGFSLMLEGISYMIGSEVPGVFVNVMRGGPGLGNIAPEQSDIKLVCRGLGHGNTHAIVLAPSTPQEMLDLTMKAFELTFKYRNPVMIVADGYLGQMTGKVKLPKMMKKPGIPDWAVYGDKAHRGNLICSIYLTEKELEEHNLHLTRKYDQMIKNEQMSDQYMCDDAEVLLVGCNTPAQMSKGAVAILREKRVKAGLFRPMTLWPFPIDKFKTVVGRARRIVVVEAGQGQLEDELRLALNKAGISNHPPISSVRRCGGILPSTDEIVQKVCQLEEVRL
ncbi:MAG: 3-methyl-2-oxobutanoate dehydrogenase subunit VorB [Oligoflexia bacterium]|nr:3-methyl-2-oxobutanoate dehydrogenase subunit VorB [Oligoflexia bacterium]MBF0367348.1 3-methyl-2-oxobutanoate dehydrogenase subunit VorB [Oligoflexia bacterium]